MADTLARATYLACHKRNIAPLACTQRPAGPSRVRRFDGSCMTSLSHACHHAPPPCRTRRALPSQVTSKQRCRGTFHWRLLSGPRVPDARGRPDRQVRAFRRVVVEAAISSRAWCSNRPCARWVSSSSRYRALQRVRHAVALVRRGGSRFGLMPLARSPPATARGRSKPRRPAARADGAHARAGHDRAGRTHNQAAQKPLGPPASMNGGGMAEPGVYTSRWLMHDLDASSHVSPCFILAPRNGTLHIILRMHQPSP